MLHYRKTHKNQHTHKQTNKPRRFSVRRTYQRRVMPMAHAMSCSTERDDLKIRNVRYITIC